MLHARVVTPPDLSAEVMDHLVGLDSVINLTHFPGAARKPDGDLVLFDVAREDAAP